MNERIRLLAEQAGYEKDMFGIGHWDMPECQKFAELIVQECMKAADEGMAQVTMKVEWPSYHIKKHFGVKE